MKKVLVIFFVLYTQYSFAQWPTQRIIIQQHPSINPMPAPIDYSSRVQDPFDAAKQGFELGRAMREEEERRNRAAQQNAEQEASRAQVIQMQRLMAEQMRQQQKMLEAQAEELKKLREANNNLRSSTPSN